MRLSNSVGACFNNKHPRETVFENIRFLVRSKTADKYFLIYRSVYSLKADEYISLTPQTLLEYFYTKNKTHTTPRRIISRRDNVRSQLIAKGIRA